MGYLDYTNRVKRVNFSKIKTVLDIPYLIHLQRESYEEFLQKDVPPGKRRDVGLQAVFKSVFPVEDPNGRARLEFLGYTIEEPKYSEEECRERGMTYAAPMKVKLQLILYDVDETTGEKHIRDVKEQEVYFGEIPLMTEKGTFVVNGTERVIVSQVQRSPGVYFEKEKGKSGITEKISYTARIIPAQGSWLDFEFDHKDDLYVKIDRKKKFPISVFLRALGFTMEDVLREFYRTVPVTLKGEVYERKLDLPDFVGKRSPVEVRHPETNQIIFRKGQKITRNRAERFKALDLGTVELPLDSLTGFINVKEIVDPETDDVLIESGKPLTRDDIELLKARNITNIEVCEVNAFNKSIWEDMWRNKIKDSETAIKEIYRKLRPTDPPTLEAAKTLFHNLFFNPERYSLSPVGRYKLNFKLGLKDVPLDEVALRKEDIVAIIRYLVDLKNGIGEPDDIDNLSNRRVRTVGELVAKAFRDGLLRVDRAIRERMTHQELETAMPHELVNSKPVSAQLKEFFGSSQLSQFMDQTNPLAEITHKRRLSALGPGGLTRDRAGFEVRDVHPTHYGRICPIETPEGPNIGLIGSLSVYARVNEYGFIETPYRVVKDGRVTNEIVYLSAIEEEEEVIAQANAPIDEEGRFLNPVVIARKKGEFAMVNVEEVTLMDVSPNQVVSVAASLIPFLEHDDANRALMGSNMQRQAVPLLKTEPPLIGTGMESVAAADSGATVVAKRGGVVEYADSKRIVIRAEEPDEMGRLGADIYNLNKFRRSNQNTCINQKPLVRVGDRVRKGEVIADGPATAKGELALGRNVLVAFMPWGGYNFEDSILISERLVRDDVYTSVHIEEFSCMARDTKMGKEEITNDIPNVGEDQLKNLDESGIVRIGARVKHGDILVGKVTPKGETQLTPEEKLLNAIFGDKARDVKDTSLRVPPGIEGIVIDTKIFTKRGGEKDERAIELEKKEMEMLQRDEQDEIRIVTDNALVRIKNLLVGKTSAVRMMSKDRKSVVLQKDKPITEEMVERIPEEKLPDVKTVEDPDVGKKIKEILDMKKAHIGEIKRRYQEKYDRLKKGDELPPGVNKEVKVYVAMKRKLSVGDKMAGRHGNKGVISMVLPVEDMPYLEDGTPVDIVLNPLGVPSRMNVGQILETHLGWAAKALGEQIEKFIEENFSPGAIRDWLRKVYRSEEFSRYLDSLSDDEVLKLARDLQDGVYMATPVFAGAKEHEIKEYLQMANLPEDGQTVLYDGRTGLPFKRKVTVGVMYMMKLNHLVDDKIHARSTGPYSLVTQQPLGGKAQFGGQRLGEMEVWALEAYGAAHTLQEFLTVKSDDVPGRARMYESIVKGEFTLEPGLPESFNVLIKELQALGLNVELEGEES
ncbi:MAG: DNA-directed RNA polymerase subunit beta [Deltaproteobacteria bacterium]|nr:MAG: DNA-directed RNA polymerase subunit beta [Deltaproteobacteria bacterium]